LSYVRIEFAGYPFQKDKEINGLTLGSVGSGTEIDHVQVSYSNEGIDALHNEGKNLQIVLSILS
jgi:hypothetical protein